MVRNIVLVVFGRRLEASGMHRVNLGKGLCASVSNRWSCILGLIFVCCNFDINFLFVSFLFFIFHFYRFDFIFLFSRFLNFFNFFDLSWLLDFLSFLLFNWFNFDNNWLCFGGDLLIAFSLFHIKL